VLGGEFIHQRAQFRKPACNAEEHRFFGREMNSDFRLEVLLNLSLPRLQVSIRDGLCAIEA
jgi:hypothetical protein